MCLFMIVILLQLAGPANAANHYCVNGRPASIELDAYHNDETLIPQLPGSPMLQRLNPISCKWQITVNSQQKDAQIVLEGRAVGWWRMASENLRSQMYVSVRGRRSKIQVSPGMFHVYRLKARTSLSIEVNWGAGVRSYSLVRLRILLPQPGTCARDMLSFRGNCYAVSSNHNSLSAAMGLLGGEAQLSSFSNNSELTDFLVENRATMKEFPYRRKIELSQPVRLGMFYSTADTTVVSVLRNGSGHCQLQPLPEIQGPLDEVHGPCGSLRAVDYDDKTLKFDHCDTPMPALVSFPEFAGFATACNSSQQLLQVNALLEDQQFKALGGALWNFEDANGTEGFFGVSRINYSAQALGTHFRNILFIIFALFLIACILFLENLSRS